ncbi:MAG: DNA cytosine methyltransferase [Desulfobulbaceae bacterium]|nr:DNA cytosine methyltransferase [Desulfobulbaceae bacterium]
MKLVDLFAGAGGLSCGLAMAGFHPVFANELVEQYAATYQANHPDTRMIVGDVRLVHDLNWHQELTIKPGDLDLLAGGPPCQGFSVNAPIRSLDDKRNHLFKDFLRVAAALRPKAVLLENVPGIVQLGQGTVVKQIYRELEALGYMVAHKILFAGHYGVPQMRFRTIFIGIHGKTKNISFPKPTYNASSIANFYGARELCFHVSPLFASLLKKHTSVWDAISDLPVIENGGGDRVLKYTIEPTTEYQKILRNGTRQLLNHNCAHLAAINLERLKYIPQGGSWRDIPPELLPAGLQRARRSDHTKRYGRLHPDLLCSTILTKCDPHWGSFFHPEQDRILSVREAARIQSFPDSYTFMGSITQQYEQVGNAVPPLLAKVIGEEIRLMLSD